MADNLRIVGKTFKLGSDWPSAETLRQLVQRAGRLFIWAATAYKFISEGRVLASDRLQEVLSGSYNEEAPETRLDGIYLTVLDKALSGNYREREKTELCDALHAVLASIAVLAAPLDRHSLSHLIATRPKA